MLKQHKNQLLETLRNTGLREELFTFTTNVKDDGGSETFIYLKKSNLTFLILQSPHAYDRFKLYYTEFVPKPRLLLIGPDTFLNKFEDISDMFTYWIDKHVKTYLLEMEASDPWSFANVNNELNQEAVSTEEFSQEEKIRTKKALKEFKIYILQTTNVTIEQRKEVENKLEYLIEAVDRLNKFDWKATATGTIIGLITSLSVDTNKGNELWNFFVNLLKDLPQLTNS